MEQAVTVDIIGDTEGKRREGVVEPQQHIAVSIVHGGALLSSCLNRSQTTATGN